MGPAWDQAGITDWEKSLEGMEPMYSILSVGAAGLHPMFCRSEACLHLAARILHKFSDLFIHLFLCQGAMPRYETCDTKQALLRSSQFPRIQRPIFGPGADQLSCRLPVRGTQNTITQVWPRVELNCRDDLDGVRCVKQGCRRRNALD